MEDKKKRHTMDVILVVIAMFLLLFVAVMLWLYYITGGIPDTLCTCVFGICGGECGVMGWIKTNKDRQRDRKFELEDRQHNEEQMKKVAGFQTIESRVPDMDPGLKV